MGVIMAEHRPDSWVVIKMTHRGETLYKVLGGWSGGYLQGSSWRLNGGIESVEFEDYRYTFHGLSGSTYVCHMDTYGLRPSTMGIWAQMKERFPDQVELLEDRDWSTMEWK